MKYQNLSFGARALIGIAVAMLITAFLLVSVVEANPLRFGTSSKSATATTTATYISAGNATTTHAYDAYAQPSGFALDQAMLLFQHSASSTLSKVRVNIEYSQDGIDWYQDGGTSANGYATTSKPYNLTQVMQYENAFASTTAGLGAPAANAATTTRALLVKTYTRFVRAVFTVPTGDGAAAIWSEWVPVRQTSE